MCVEDKRVGRTYTLRIACVDDDNSDTQRLSKSRASHLVVVKEGLGQGSITDDMGLRDNIASGSRYPKARKNQCYVCSRATTSTIDRSIDQSIN